MSPTYDSRQIRRAFARAADGYDAAAALQHEVEARLLESLEHLGDRVPARALDLGCGPGRAAAVLKKRWPNAEVIATDVAMPMLAQARRRAGWWRPFRLVCADAAALPFADGCLDVVFSSLCLQWTEDLPATLAELRRVLRPDGLLLFSTFGPDTLIELREAFAAADASAPHVSPFAQIQRVGDALMAAGFRDPVLDRDHFDLTWPDVPALMRELRAIGATNALAARRRTLTGKARMRRVFDAYEALRRDGALPSTWEVIYVQAWGPVPGAPRRTAQGEIATVPIASIGRRRR